MYIKKCFIILLSFICLLSGGSNLFPFEYNWKIESNNPNPIWIVAPGIFNTTRVSARYCGKKGFIAPTGESIINPNCIDIAVEVFVDSTQHPEIIPFQQLPVSPLSLSIFGLAQQIRYAHQKLAQKYHAPKNSNNDSKKNTIALQEYSIRLSELNIAQQKDINTLYDRYNACAQKFPNRAQIWIGHSRGAATIFNTLALKTCPHVDLAIVEACFDSMAQVFFNYQPNWALKLQGHKFLEWLLVNLTSHDINGICPINSVPFFPKQIPILFVSSKKDRAVPIACTINLAQSLANTGHKNVYLLIIDRSTHSGFTYENEQDKTIYQQVVHALYQQLGLPHIPAYADPGKPLLQKCHLQAQIINPPVCLYPAGI